MWNAPQARLTSPTMTPTLAEGIDAQKMKTLEQLRQNGWKLDEPVTGVSETFYFQGLLKMYGFQ